MLPRQTSLSFSVYSDLYDKLIPRDNKLRQLNDLVDFTFVYDEFPRDTARRTVAWL